ncbi:hypothetical protein BD560DRAFT_414970 [Blakeslea trispora]|nr:hypothetical protein BD560DRAFT_414970 [Blakeslea trispora]
MTIHKSQGSTYDNVVISLNGRSLSRSLLYVACSRATSLGLYLIGYRFVAPQPPKNTDAIAIELTRQATVSLQTKFSNLYSSNTHAYQLMFHNVQSLNAHVDQLINDPAYMGSDFLLFAETRTTANQTIQIPGYHQVSRVDVEGNIPRANGSICFVKASLLETSAVTEKN